VFSPDFAFWRFKARGRETVAFIRWQKGGARTAEDYLRIEVCFPEAVVLRKFLRNAWRGFPYCAREIRAGSTRAI